MKPNKFITVIFVLVLVLAIYTLVSELRKRKSRSRPAAPSQSASVLPSDGARTEDKCVLISGTGQTDSKGTSAVWGRDPFVYPKVFADKDEGAALPWKLTSVMISGGQRTATLDQAPYIVSVGDRLGNSRILQIEPDRIILKGEGEKRELLLEGSK